MFNNSYQIGQIEQAMRDHFESNPDFLPYIQRHELEALMFSSREGFELVIDDEHGMRQIDQIIEEYPNPEDINNGPDTAPSKRLERIFHYDKVNDGELIFGMLTVEAILEKCPRFSSWIGNIERKLSEEVSN